MDVTSSEFSRHGYTGSIIFEDKELIISAVNLSSEAPIPDLAAMLEDIFTKIAPHLRRKRQTVYIRDIAMGTIDGTYPGGNAYMPEESRISVPGWPVKEDQLVAVLAHELHHIARWQNPGYGETLGAAIASEGLATLFQELETGWTPPWALVEVSKAAWDAILQDWDNEQYDHSKWFYYSDFGKWVAYAAGYQLAKTQFKDEFDLKASIMITGAGMKKNIEKTHK